MTGDAIQLEPQTSPFLVVNCIVVVACASDHKWTSSIYTIVVRLFSLPFSAPIQKNCEKIWMCRLCFICEQHPAALHWNVDATNDSLWLLKKQFHSSCVFRRPLISLRLVMSLDGLVQSTCAKRQKIKAASDGRDVILNNYLWRGVAQSSWRGEKCDRKTVDDYKSVSSSTLRAEKCSKSAFDSKLLLWSERNKKTAFVCSLIEWINWKFFFLLCFTSSLMSDWNWKLIDWEIKNQKTLYCLLIALCKKRSRKKSFRNLHHIWLRFIGWCASSPHA